MISDEVAAQLEDQRLRLDQEVLAVWVDRGKRYQGRGRIVELRPRQVTVELLHPVGSDAEYRPGVRVRIPRYGDQIHWFSDCRVRKIPDEPFIHKDFL